MSDDPIHQNSEGKWCFWDRAWSDELGLYDTEAQARAALEEYCALLEWE